MTGKRSRETTMIKRQFLAALLAASALAVNPAFAWRGGGFGGFHAGGFHAGGLAPEGSMAAPGMLAASTPTVGPGMQTATMPAAPGAAATAITARWSSTIITEADAWRAVAQPWELLRQRRAWRSARVSPHCLAPATIASSAATPITSVAQRGCSLNSAIMAFTISSFRRSSRRRNERPVPASRFRVAFPEFHALQGG